MAANEPIRFNLPFSNGREAAYIAETLASGKLSGDGDFTKRCHRQLESMLGAHRVMLTTSCTHALEMAALLLDIGPGDEVIMPSFTFVSTANAFVLRGAKPVFCDVREATLNLDEELLPKLITAKTKAIVPVHYAGVGCAMDKVMAIADAKGIPVVEDAAHALMGRFHGRALGTFGALGALSFHDTKNFTSGEGGALVINDPKLVERAEIIREKGTNRSRFFRGEVDKYTWVDIGSSYLPSEILAAHLLAQLEAADEIQARRQRVWRAYFSGLMPWAKAGGALLPSAEGLTEGAFHLFYVLMPTVETRQELISHLKERGVPATFHYLPLDQSPMGQKLLGSTAASCPVSSSAADRLVRLPLHAMMSEAQTERVIAAVREYLF